MQPLTTDTSAQSQVRFLSEAAHLLATTAPTTSRHLMSACKSRMIEANLEPSDANRSKVCNACGTIMMLNSASLIQLEPLHPENARGRRSTRALAEKNIVHTCGACLRKTRLRLPTDIRPQRSKLRRMESVSSAPLVPDMSRATTTSSSNASSKQRARRRRGGLEALLASKKTSDSQSSRTRLDLLDLMQKG